MSKDTRRPEVMASTVAAAMLGVSSPAMAATLQVTSLGSSVNPSDNITTLREAIQQANSSAGTDVITFASELSGTINTGGSASLPYIYDSLVILGDNRITLDGAGDDSILQAKYQGTVAPVPPAPEITSDGPSAATVSSPKGNLSVSGLTLTGAQGPAIEAIGYGGGNLTVDDTTITGNGAAIYAGGKYQTTVVRNSTISGNVQTSEGSEGGTITQFGYYYGGSTLTITDSTIRNNQAQAGAVFQYSYGPPGIYANRLTVEGSTISGNTGATAGGLSAYASEVGVNNTVVRGNQATATEAEFSGGGGLSLALSDAEIRNSEISNNTAPSGGGISSKYGQLELESVEVSGNSATAGPGGGINAFANSYGGDGWLQVESSLITGNSSTGPGAGVFTVLTGGESSNANVNLHSTVVKNNQAQAGGGGLYFEVGSGFTSGQVSIAGSTVANNTAAGNGGGLLVRSTGVPLSVTNSRITGNSASESSGGGMALRLEAGPTYRSTVSGSVISGNTAQDYGGGIYALIDDTNELSIQDTRLNGNTAYYDGGGIYAGAVDSGSGAVAGTLAVERSTLDANYAGYMGGAVSANGYYDAAVNVVNTTISGNTAGTGAGALYLSTGSSSEGSGGSASVDGSTLYGNTITTGEGTGARRSQVYLSGQAVSAAVDHTVIAGNTTGSSIAVNRVEAGTALDADFSLLGGVHGTNSGNSDLDTVSTNLEGTAVNPGPLQDNGGITPTHLPEAGGPLNDGGDTVVPASLNDEDQRGFSRLDGTPPVNGNTDIGAVELQDFDGNGTIDNLPPEFTGNLPAALSGRVGRSVDINVLNYVTDPEGYMLTGSDISFQGLPAGLSYNTSNGKLTGTLDATGTFLVRATATDDLGASASIQEEVTVNKKSAFVSDDDDDDFLGGITPQWLLILAGLLGLGRRRR